jgi:hypothetical protein
MPKTAVEAATLIGVAAASFYAMGTVAHLSYLNALGFDAHQFPPVGLELHLEGVEYTVWPALVVGGVALAYACLFALTDRFAGWLSRAPAKWRIPLALVMMAAVSVAVAAYFNPPATLMQWIVAGVVVGIIVLTVILRWEWVLLVAACWCIGAQMLLLVIQYVSGQAYALGEARAAKAGNNHATTIIEFTDGHKIPAPGTRIVCSEHFCGFHDGTTATVISLEGVRSIQSPEPQGQPPHTSDK